MSKKKPEKKSKSMLCVGLFALWVFGFACGIGAIVTFSPLNVVNIPELVYPEKRILIREIYTIHPIAKNGEFPKGVIKRDVIEYQTEIVNCSE